MPLKQGVDIANLKPQMVLAYCMIQDIYTRRGYTCTVTAGEDGKHMDGSLHSTGQALDFRIKNVISIDKPGIIKDIKDALGQDFDVLLEEPGTANEHVHVEYQRRDRIVNPEER